jgi:hypothetical protein
MESGQNVKSLNIIFGYAYKLIKENIHRQLGLPPEVISFYDQLKTKLK